MITVPEDSGSGWRSIIVNVAIATAMSGGIAYLATVPEQLAPVVTNATKALIHPRPPQAPPTVHVEDTPLRLTNPFDTTEVFEFPSGTSEIEAHQKVAELLAERARDRLRSWSRDLRHQKKAADLRVSGVEKYRG